MLVSSRRILNVLLCRLYNLPSCSVSLSAGNDSYQCQDKRTQNCTNIPLRLLDCLGFAIPFCALGAFADFGVVVFFRFEGGGGGDGCGAGAGAGAGLITGELKKTDGEGIVIVSISSISGDDALAIPGGAVLNPSSGR